MQIYMKLFVFYSNCTIFALGFFNLKFLLAMTKYLDPKNDLTFKRVFGEHKHLKSKNSQA